MTSGRVGPEGRKTGPIGSCWPQIGFKFGLTPIMYLLNQNEPDLNPTVHIKKRLKDTRTNTVIFYWTKLTSIPNNFVCTYVLLTYLNNFLISRRSFGQNKRFYCFLSVT